MTVPPYLDCPRYADLARMWRETDPRDIEMRCAILFVHASREVFRPKSLCLMAATVAVLVTGLVFVVGLV